MTNFTAQKFSFGSQYMASYGNNAYTERQQLKYANLLRSSQWVDGLNQNYKFTSLE